MRYKDHSVIVTGAARGIGAAIARSYAAEGARVILADLLVEQGERTADDIRSGGGQARFIACDVSREEQVVALIARTVEHYGAVDILINNAGIADPHQASFYDLTGDQWDRVMNTNAKGCFLTSREAAKIMRLNEQGGAIVHISSTRALMSEPHTEAYAASKGAIASLTHAMAVSLGPDGITVNCIYPGWIETGDYRELREIDHAQHPAGRVGKPEDIARACLYLTDSVNRFITGAGLVVDGGMTVKMIYEP
ncbi:SDR family oxidoreductase [Paenibacillus spiritus]|uniref:SDR family oxidoreductase n=1 Tax=Paenibacillus spiritus TaxID=2496557 RepID=A0A5J5GFP5_9BACL|nr:SDR family oxidoreductase [Paenibacillus spiritus]KAA9006582.1 SDR family oxidoreductase [Paenibacillus spiritus]